MSKKSYKTNDWRLYTILYSYSNKDTIVRHTCVCNARFEQEALDECNRLLQMSYKPDFKLNVLLYEEYWSLTHSLHFHHKF